MYRSTNTLTPPTTTRFRPRWIDIILMLIICVLVGTGTIVGLSTLGHMAQQHSVSINKDPSGGSLPRCTDAIADAGGMCWGEPLPACPTEDSDNCYWDARTMGNGRGDSFYVVDGDVTYVQNLGER